MNKNYFTSVHEPLLDLVPSVDEWMTLLPFTPFNRFVKYVISKCFELILSKVKNQIVVRAKKFPMSKTNLVHSQNTQKMSLGAT